MRLECWHIFESGYRTTARKRSQTSMLKIEIDGLGWGACNQAMLFSGHPHRLLRASKMLHTAPVRAAVLLASVLSLFESTLGNYGLIPDQDVNEVSQTILCVGQILRHSLSYNNELVIWARGWHRRMWNCYLADKGARNRNKQSKMKGMDTC